MPNAEPNEVIASVLGAVGIKQVISVDDRYGNGSPKIDVDDLVASLLDLDPGIRSQITEPLGFGADDPIVLRRQFKTFWERAEDPEKLTFHRAVKRARGTQEVENAEVDLRGVEELPGLFRAVRFEEMNLGQWRGKSAQVFVDSLTSKTLILFDEDFSDDGGSVSEGLTLIREALAATQQDSVVCCLLSHKYHEDTLQTAWKALCKEQGFPQDRVIVIPKELLVGKPNLFASLVKLAAVAPSYETMRTEIREIVKQGVEAGDREIGDLSLLDLDRMVFRASTREGVWEPDTLFRIFSVYQSKASRQIALRSKTLRGSSAAIRKISGIDTPYESEGDGAVWDVNRRENYEEGDELNALSRPIEAGDIFARGSKRYILIGPPCDLMVRSSGFRGSSNDLVREVVLAEITERPSAAGITWKLDFYEKGGVRFVDLKKTISVKLDCLDLCVFNADGKSQLSVDSAPPELLIPAWERRHGIMRERISKLFEQMDRIKPTPSQRQAVEVLLTSADSLGAVSGRLISETKTLEMNVQRVARLLAPRATALLKAYAAFLNRDAFEHTYGAANVSQTPSRTN